MKSIKKQLLLAVLGVVFGFSMMIFVVTLSQMIHQKNRIQEQGQEKAQSLSEETGEKLEKLNEQVAEDFSGACTKYFNIKFASIRKHVNAIKKEMAGLYREGKDYGMADDNFGLMKGVQKTKIREEFGMISPVRRFIKYLPDYNVKEIGHLDLYVVTESGMCLDGTETALGDNYADLRRENWYKTAKKTGKTYWSGIFKGKVTKKIKVTCAMPVYDAEGAFRGCVSGDVAVEAFRDMIEEFDEEQITSVIFFDRSDKMMYATNNYKDAARVKKYLGREKIVNLGDEIYSFTTLEETGWKICLVLDQDIVTQTTKKLQADIEGNAAETAGIVQESIRKTILFFGISMAAGVLLAVAAANFLAAGFVRPIRKLMSQVKEAGSGNLEQEIAVRSRNEIGQLADAFQNMTGELREYMDHLQGMAADKERMTAELNIARQIQMNMLPNKFPAFPERKEFDIYAAVSSVDRGGSNFYDFFMVDKTHFCIVVGDVSGTGIPATLFAVITMTNIKNYAQLGYQPDRILAETNNQLSHKNEAGLSVSVFTGIVDLHSGIFQYCNAGQMSPLWKHSGNDFVFLEAKSCFELASMENVPYQQQSVRLAQGDMLFLYTQGVPETVDSKGGEYTQEYLLEYLNLIVKHQYPLREITDSVKLDMERFSGGQQQEKDSTLMALRYLGK